MTSSAGPGIQSGMHPHDAEAMDAYLEHLRRANRSPDTIKLRRKILTQLDLALPYGLGRADDEELAAWVYDKRRAINSRATYLAGVRGFYRWAAKNQWLELDPAAELESVKASRGIARPCSDEQLATILAKTPPRVRLWATIAAYAGLRCCEISGLDREHVTEQRLIVVRGKGGAARVHDTHEDIWAAVRGLPPGPLARRQDGSRASADYVSTTAKYWFRKVGVDVTAHQLRHWLGCTVQAQYRDARVTMELLGHSSLSSTQVYTRATLDQQRQARAMLPRLAGTADASGAGGGSRRPG
jgi:integrase/recombinase XerC